MLFSGDYIKMKFSVSGKAPFFIKVALVCVIFALTAAACISGSLAVSGEGKLGRYLPDVVESDHFRATLVAAIAVVIVMLVLCKLVDKIAQNDAAKATDEVADEVADEVVDEATDSITDEASDMITKETEGEASDMTTKSSGSKLTSVFDCVSRCFSILPAIVALYVFYIALSDESLGTWGNAIMLTAFVSGLFFIFKMFKGAIVGKVICGLGVFALCAVIIASLYL